MENLPQYKIGIVGPSRTGKTTLMTCILESAKKLLAGSSLEIVADDNGTQTLLDQNAESLDGALIAGVFNAGSLEGTEETTIYDLILRINELDALRFSFLDYPGGWLKARPMDWKIQCEPWLNDSNVLLIPIDSTVIMEAGKKQEYMAAVPGILTIATINNVVRTWAKRKKAGNKPCYVILAPLKCETYMSDSGGNPLEDKLRDSVFQYYHKTVMIPFEEGADVKVLYCPIDTFGCVQLKKANWSQDEDKRYRFSADFEIRNPKPVRIQKGAGDILIKICELLLGLSGKSIKENLQMEKYNLNGIEGTINEISFEKENTDILDSLLKPIMKLFGLSKYNNSDKDAVLANKNEEMAQLQTKCNDLFQRLHDVEAAIKEDILSKKMERMVECNMAAENNISTKQIAQAGTIVINHENIS